MPTTNSVQYIVCRRHFLLCPVTGVRSIAMSVFVCLCVCLSACISQKDIFYTRYLWPFLTLYDGAQCVYYPAKTRVETITPTTTKTTTTTTTSKPLDCRQPHQKELHRLSSPTTSCDAELRPLPPCRRRRRPHRQQVRRGARSPSYRCRHGQ